MPPLPPAVPHTTCHPTLSGFLLPPWQVCREYQRGNCNRGENDCRFAHPADSAMIDTNDNTVTVCMDYIKGRCSREKCKYFHPPAHLQAKIKAAQYQVNQAAAAQAAATAAAMVSVQVAPRTAARQQETGSEGLAGLAGGGVLGGPVVTRCKELSQHVVPGLLWVGVAV